MVFVDSKQAYNSISRKDLWKTMISFRIHQKYVALVKICNSNTNLEIRFWQETSTQFKNTDWQCINANAIQHSPGESGKRYVKRSENEPW